MQTSPMDIGGFVTVDDHVLVVVAHPDDETFGCGSLIALAAAAGARVSIVCATRGELGEVTDRVDLAGRTLGEVREGELRDAAAMLGAAHVEVLDFVDSGFDGPQPAGALCGADPATLRDTLAAIVERERPTIVLSIDGSDGHRDHVCVRDAIIDVADQVTPRPRVYLATLSNHAMRRWLDEKLRSDESSAYHGLDPDTLGRPDDEISFTLDSRPVLTTRLAAIELHRSQRSPFEGLSVELRDLFLCVEHLVEA
jgi:LmbE family N-acetylglucosaminyl deacetylase